MQASTWYLLFYPGVIGLLLLLAWFFFIGRKRLAAIKIQPDYPPIKRIFYDAFYSFLSLLMYVPTWLICLYIYFKHGGWVYSGIETYGIFYFLLSIFLVIFVHDTYYYFWHRFVMHHPFFFKHFHRVHHESHNPTILTFYALHPFESFFASLSAPLSMFLFPLCLPALAIGTLFHTLQTLYVHGGYEIFPTKKVFPWLNTSVAHNLHHQHINVNFSYYFVVWDRLFNTLDKSYETLFQKVRERAKTGVAPFTPPPS